MYFAPVCTSTYRLEQNETLIVALDLEMSVSVRAHAQMSTLRTRKYQIKERTRAALYIYRLLRIMN